MIFFVYLAVISSTNTTDH